MKKLFPLLGALLVGTTVIGGSYASASVSDVKVVDVSEEESNAVDYKLPFISYMVVGGSPKDFEFERKDEVKRYINLTDEEVEIEELNEVEDLGATYQELEDSVSLGSVINLGNIGLYGNSEDELSINSEDLINLKPGGSVEEYVMEYSEDEGYKLLGKYSELDLTLSDIEDKDLSLVAFINNFKEEEAELEEAKEAESEQEEESEEEVETEDSEDKVETEESEGETEEEEEELEEEEVLERGEVKFLGDKVEVREQDGVGVLVLTEEQFKVIMEDADKPYKEKRIFKDTGVTSEEEVYTKLGLYNIPTSMVALFDEDLDEDGDGVLYKDEDLIEIKHMSVESSSAKEFDEDATTEHENTPGGVGEEWEGEEDTDPNEVEDSEYEEGGDEVGGVVEEDNGDESEWEDFPSAEDNEEIDMEGAYDDDLPEVETSGGEAVTIIDEDQFDDEGNYIGEVGEEYDGEDDTGENQVEDSEYTEGGLNYEYDNEGNLIRITDADGNLIAERDTNGVMSYSVGVEDNLETIGIEDTRKGLVNDEGYLVDEEGNYVDEDGNRVSTGVLPDTGLESTGVTTVLAIIVGVLGSMLMFFRKPNKEKLVDLDEEDSK